jgi:hypothetical protein
VGRLPISEVQGINAFALLRSVNQAATVRVVGVSGEWFNHRARSGHDADEPGAEVLSHRSTAVMTGPERGRLPAYHPTIRAAAPTRRSLL